METTTYYRFYLEPYTFIFREEEEVLIYNTLNAKSIYQKGNPHILKVAEDLQNLENGYCTEISEEELKDATLLRFVNNVKTTFSGDLIPLKEVPSKPFIFPPKLRLYADIAQLREAFAFVGKEILKNINEVTIYLACDCGQCCKGCRDYNKQLPHCSLFPSSSSLSFEEYKILLQEVNAGGIAKVNFSGGDLLKYNQLNELLTLLPTYDFKKTFYVESKNLTPEYHKFICDDLSSLAVFIHPPYDQEALISLREEFQNCNVEWTFIVETDEDLKELEAMSVDDKPDVNITPFYNTRNITFFEKNVFCSLDDIFSRPIDKRTIFRRQVVNENFFGKLYILPSGDVYTNLNVKLTGNIREKPLGEIAFMELETPQAWTMIRDKGPCKTCVNKYLCPSPSDYESVINKPNLCHVKK